ncbi:MAG: serine/threonine protein kinase [Polyangiaceae bacterium]|nr:serine/threonine protein kinase [Polyangiaceae bacterium]
MRICPACSREYPDERTHCQDDGIKLVSLDKTAALRAEQLVGQLVEGRYRIERVLGHGGMGTVYACRHVVVGKALAMKVLRPPRGGHSESVLQRFIREAQTANALKSRHIIETTDFGQLPDGPFFVVMELLEGIDLSRAMRENRLNAPQLLHVFIQIADALEVVHARGIVHRDLKPDNVFLVTENGDPLFVKLLDFGIAKVLHTGSSHLTEEGMVLGTPHYMAPEQARSEAIDHRVDIYSLGVMMYRAFTGRLPFVADSAIGVMTRHAMDPPEPPSQFMAIDKLLEALILRCMAKRPDERPQRMAEIAQNLRMLLMKMSGGFPIPSSALAPYATGSNPAVAALSHPVSPGSTTGASYALAATPMPLMHESATHRALVTSSTGMVPPIAKPRSSPLALVAFVAVALVFGGGGAFVMFGMRGREAPKNEAASSAVVSTPVQAAPPVDAPSAAAASASAEPELAASAAEPSASAVSTANVAPAVRKAAPVIRSTSTPTTTTKPSRRPEIRSPFE